MCDLVKNYRDDCKLRYSFNNLAKKTYGLDFEDWYQNGYWGDSYNPYSIVKDGEVIANVSVNLMNIRWNGVSRHLVQLGTVMTDIQYRKQGLIRKIMEAIEVDYANKVDGMYLFANDSVVEFYPKFGYRKAIEYQYSKQVSITSLATVIQTPMNNKDEWKSLENAIHSSKFYGRFDMINNSELYMFYVTKFMQKDVYYDKALDAYAIAEIEGDKLLIHAVFSEHEVELNDVIRAFGENIKKVTLGFIPKNASDYICTELQEDNNTLFVKGSVFSEFEKEFLMFPTLSHA